jgi:hypothetical protein
MKPKLNPSSLRRNRKAVSPAFSTMILTAGVIVMILVAMAYAGNILNLKLAQNEFTANKQFMQTTGQQMDDIAWTIGRTQSIAYSSRFGAIKFEETVLSYHIRFHNSSGWFESSAETGIILFNMPVSAYSMGGGYFERVPFSANSSFILFGSQAPVYQVLCEEKLPMQDGSYLRVMLIPTMRVLNSTITGGQSYLKFYLPSLESGSSSYKTQALTLTGGGISKIKPQGNVDQVNVTVSFPKASELGFDESFFQFNSTSVILNSASTPPLKAGSTVEFYIGKVQVSIGAA